MGAFDWLRSTASGIFGGTQPASGEGAAPQQQQPSFFGTGAGPVDGIVSAVGHYADAGALNASFKMPWEDDEPPKKLEKGLGPAVEQLKKSSEKTLERLAKEKAETAAQVDAEAKNDPEFKKDPEGARKRAAEFVDAKKDLEGMFEVVDGKTKDRKQNQLTDAEMREVTKRYADIKAGRGDLKLGSTPGATPEAQERDRKNMLKDIGRIMQTKSGRDLIKGLHNNTGPDKNGKPGTQHHTTTINPGSFDIGTTERVDPAHPFDHSVHYEPGKISDEGRATKDEQWAHLMRSDVVLYHELTHAYHASHYDGAGRNEENQVVGLGDYAPGGSKAYKFNENLYRSERNNITDRGRYTPTDAELSPERRGRYPDWESWVTDGKMKPRPKYTPDVD